MFRKTLGAVAVVSLGLGLAGCSSAGFKANAEDCASIEVYIDEVNVLIDATSARMSDTSMRRAGASLWSEKLDELESEVKPRESQLQEALNDWVAKSRAVANAIRPYKMDQRVINEASDAFQISNVLLGSMCSK